MTIDALPDDEGGWCRVRCTECGTDLGTHYVSKHVRIGHDCPVRTLRERVDALEARMKAWTCPCSTSARQRGGTGT